MYFCPSCQSRLKTWHVLSAGPLGARRCGNCGQEYFGGGIPAAMVALSISAYIGGLALLLTGKFYFLWLAPLLGVIPSTWLAVRSQPKRANRKWLEAAMILAPGFVLWAAYKGTFVLAKLVAQ